MKNSAYPKQKGEALGGVGTQYELEIVCHSLKKELEEKGVWDENCYD